jgi:pyruvate/2-oxoglutarate dehydrogenase complex dihydrolipoamide acyltransferase (E2) component
MGDSISEGAVEKFVNHPGDFLNADKVIARIETIKIPVDITGPVSGILK